MSPLSAARAAFLAAPNTLVNERRDFPEWHRGRPRYALWAVDLDIPSVRSAMDQAARHLEGLLLPGYCRQPHITLALGGFPTLTAALPDDYPATALKAHLNSLAGCRQGAFPIRVETLASFSSAPFLTVVDPEGGIARLRHALAGPAEPAGGPYLPHVTVGLYAGAWPTRTLQARLDAFIPGPPLAVQVESLSLMAYSAPDIGGPLETLARWHLGRNHLEWLEDAAHCLPDPSGLQT